MLQLGFGIGYSTLEKRHRNLKMMHILLPLAITLAYSMFSLVTCTSSSLAKVPIRFSPLPLGGFRQVFKHSANLRLTSFASNILVVGSLVIYQFICICQRSTGLAYDEVLTTYKPYSALIFDVNDVSRNLAEYLKSCLNPPRGREEKRIGTLASDDAFTCR